MLHLQDFATPSLGSTDQLVDDDDVDFAGENDTEHVLPEVTQFCLRRHWETRYQKITWLVLLLRYFFSIQELGFSLLANTLLEESV